MNNRAQILALALTLGLIGCGHAADPPLPPAVPPVTEPPPPPPRPLGVRADLGPEWFGPDGQLRPPLDDGFNAPPVQSTLQPGRLIDQFGAPGKIFSPKGEPFAQRSLPTLCTAQPYAVYRVLKPLPVASGKALAWFGQTGGATRYEADQASDALVAQHILEPVPDPGPAPCDAP